MINIFLLAIYIILINSETNKQLQMPQVIVYKEQFPIEEIKANYQQRFSFYFQNMGLQISSKILIADKSSLMQTNMMNYSSYKQAKNCQFFPTNFNISQFGFQYQNFYTNYYLISTKQKKVYFGETNQNYGQQKGKLLIYNFSVNEAKLSFYQSVDLAAYNLQQTFSHILFEVLDFTYVTDGSKLIQLPKNNQQKPVIIQGFNTRKNDSYKGIPPSAVIKIQNMGNNSNKFWVLKTNQLTTFILKQSKVQKLSHIEFEKEEVYIDGYYEQSSDRFFLLSSLGLHLFKFGKPSTLFQHQGYCHSIKKDRQTIHLICQIQRKSFIAEYLLQENDVSKPKIILNRYYNHLENALDIFYLGAGRQIMYGQLQSIIMNRDVHQQVLFDLQKQQNLIGNFLEKPIFQMKVIPQLSDHATTTIVVVSIDSIYFMQINQTIPHAICNFAQNYGNQVYLIGVFNTSTCSNMSQDSSLRIICEKWKFFNVIISNYQVSHDFGTRITILIIIICALLMVFFLKRLIARIINLRNSIQEIAMKIQKIKQKNIKNV